VHGVITDNNLQGGIMSKRSQQELQARTLPPPTPNNNVISPFNVSNAANYNQSPAYGHQN